MSDLIKREDAINSIYKLKKTVIKQDVLAYCDGLFDALEIVQDLPSADRWIPCSERLPNDGDKIVIQYANGDLGVINSCRMRLWNIINSPYATVVAWMPSPELWKGADDE